ncbi:MAG: chitobiase/beta-hexosaminidase C-terminal domain-containing protein [Paludibacteraceae bacterium]|nr:chitobiase/beta-hexosaminidase C-terminal domain-containing protein [Paludibacteraceae bacterium]
MKHFKLFFALFAMLALGVGNAWGADSGLTASDGVFVIDFYNSDKLTSTSGTDLTTSNYSSYVKVADGLNAKDVVTNVSKSGTVQYNKNGGLTVGSSSANSHYVTFDIGTDYAVKKVTVYATKYETGRFLLNGKAADSGELGAKNAQFSTVTKPLVWDNLDGVTTLKFTKDNGSGSNQKRLTIYTIVCEYETSSGGDEPVASLTVNPTTIDFGTVYEGATVADKTVAVNFANLTGNVTYSALSTPFSATGTISATGDKITISADASTIGEYSDTLTVASTADSKTAEVIVKMNVVEKPAPTGTFTLHTGELIEGDYVIYYSGKAMKALLDTKNRLQYEEVTPTDNKIVDPLVATIWHIAPTGTNWTVYNETVSKYAASTGTKSEADLVADLTGDNANKAAWTVTASGNAYEFVNVWNKSKSVNANLRNNTIYGFACYATGTGGALSLYRKAGTMYNVTVSSTTNGTVTADPTSAEAGTTITLTVTPAGGYVLDALTVTDASSNPVTVTDNKFTMPASDVTVTATFKENEKPAATLTLSKNGVEETFPGSWKQDDVVTLPSINSDCVKEFVGWSANPTCNVAPEYAAGDSYTLTATAQTLYAVYATVGAGETLTITPSAVSGSADPYTFTIDATGYSLTAKKNSGSTAPTYNATNKDVRVYAKGTVTLIAPKAMGTIVFNISTNGKKRLAPITASVGTIATQASGDATVTWTGDATEVTFTVGDIAEFGSENTKAGQLCFGTMTVTTAGSYSNYSTTCAAALANPTFSLAEGKYTEAKSITISAAEGTIYYTLDGAEPTTSSTQYTGPIALNDCGEYTIKAIAISSDSQSDVVSATYTIKLPLTNSEAAPYTEAEAIAVYDGGCYDNQDVYVKGTVKTATFYTSGTYTITLTNGFQFYKFYKSASKELFTDGAINAGDVLVARGKLSKYNTTYQLAEGCYLVSQEKYEGEKTDISNTEGTAYTVDKAFELIGDVSSDLTKTVYVKGLVAVAPTSNPTADGQMTYSISDNGENTGNVLKVYLGLNLNGEKFTSKNDVQLGDYVVVKGQLLDYNGTYELNKGNQLVQHKKAATITIADITMEVGETKTISATVTPADATVTYTIKENTANAISLSGNVITANTVGSATITATIATAADYMGKTVDFTVTVNAKSTKEKVVILAEYEGQWYAMKAQYVTDKTSHLAPLPVTYFDGKLYNVNEADKALIEWERAVVDGKATFSNNSKYLTGKSDKTDLTLAATACEWTVSGDSYLIGARTFLYNAENNWFRNFGTSNAGNKNYSDMPTVTAPVYATGDPVYTRTIASGDYGTICLPYASSSYSGAEFYEISWMELDEDGITPKGIWLDEVNGNLTAGKPYIFKATSTVLTVNCTGSAVANPAAGEAGLVGTFKLIQDSETSDDPSNTLEGNYMIAGNQFLLCGTGCWLKENRAYIDASIIAGHTTKKAEIPGRRRVCLGETSENTTTGVDNNQLPNANIQKVIENGQLIIIRDGVKYNVQGVRF